jgi:hypothetical protein
MKEGKWQLTSLIRMNEFPSRTEAYRDVRRRSALAYVMRKWRGSLRFCSSR